MTEKKTEKTENTESKMAFEKEKLDLVKLRIRNKFYDRSDVLEEVINSILKKDIPKSRSNS